MLPLCALQADLASLRTLLASVRPKTPWCSCWGSGARVWGHRCMVLLMRCSEVAQQLDVDVMLGSRAQGGARHEGHDTVVHEGMQACAGYLLVLSAALLPTCLQQLILSPSTLQKSPALSVQPGHARQPESWVRACNSHAA